ncbi:hypothetical protein R1sor_002721 [Riccia sorocarpa]|uniref:Uncharacterized protein n=1 Tax=Riccia sorocarpa TaxID=122646 RepID=A0ABD3H3J0_9MARC
MLVTSFARWEALKDTYLTVTGMERKLKIEVDEMEGQLKGLQGELGRIVKCCDEDEVTIELVKDDAEAAEAEAGMMREREQAALMEVTDLTRLQELYQEKIQEIEREHATALAPILSRLKLDIQDAKDSIAENQLKQEQFTKEIEDCKTKLEETIDEISNIRNRKKDTLDSIEILDGQPDKYRKQADILTTAVKSLQTQDQKWVDKVRDVDLSINGHQAAVKKLQEELAVLAIQIEKNRQQTEQKERQAADFQRDLELAALEVDDYLADQVNVDMQLRSRMLDLKAEQEHLANRNKEKDKVLRRLKYEEQLVANIQAHLPALIMDRDKLHQQLLLVEAAKEKVTTQVNEIRREIDVQMRNFLVVEGLGKEVAAALRASHEKVQKLEKEVRECANIERLKNQHITNLTGIRERMCRQAAAKVPSNLSTKFTHYLCCYCYKY